MLKYLFLSDRDKCDLIAYQQIRKEAPWINYWCQASFEKREFISSLLPYSRSQHGQDIFAACHAQSCGVLESGFFVEFGATDGVSLSNSWLLENRLGWSGILSEPARIWHDLLSTSRSCTIDHRCVTDQTGMYVDFLETSQGMTSRPELSTIQAFVDSDRRGRRRKSIAVSYPVETVSLIDLLDQHHAPTTIDYISIDTEGSEFLILSGFDFTRYRFRSITVEHNRDVVKRRHLYDLLTKHGYQRVHSDISMCDDWYCAV